MHLNRPMVLRMGIAFGIVAALGFGSQRLAPTEASAQANANLIVNPGFENGTSGWYTFGAAAGTTTSSGAQRGRASASFGPGEQGLGQSVTLKPDTIYAFSGWGKNSGSAYAQITLRVTDGSGASIDYQMPFSGGEWLRQARTITTPPSVQSAVVYLLKNAGGGTFAVDTLLLAEGRDAQAWPFAASSIWNQPIGANAVYVPANLDAEPAFGLDEGSMPYGDWNMPRREAFTRGENTSRNDFGPCNRDQTQGGVGVTQGTVQVPDSFILNNWTRNPYFTPNNMTWIVQGDGRTLAQFQPTARCERADAIFGYRATDQDLYGNGIAGGHFGSGLSSLGGAIRMGELVGPGPIRHALQIDIYMERYASKERPFRWPADRADWAHFNTPYTYCSQDPCKSNPAAHAAVSEGSLLALPPNVTPASLGITSAVGTKIFTALQNYGGYIVDNSGYTWQLFGAEYGVKEEVKQAYGVDMFTSVGAAGPSGQYAAEIAAIWEALHVVDNNGPANIGGGGTPRAAAAPSFANPVPPPTVKLPRNGWKASSAINGGEIGKLLDNQTATYWRTSGEQTSGQSFVVDLNGWQVFNQVSLDNTANAPEYPQNYAIFISNDGANWGAPVFQGTGSGTAASIASFPIQRARYVKVQLYGGHIAHVPWSVGEFNLYLSALLVPGSATAPTATPTNTPVPTATPTPLPSGSYQEDFNDGQAQGWSLTAAAVENNALRLNNWGGDSLAVYDGASYTNFTYRLDVNTVAGADGNKFRAVFNYSDADNYTFLEIGGGSANTLELRQRTAGNETTLATYAGSLSINGATSLVISVTNGAISVSATKDGTSTALFSSVAGPSGGGKIGVGGRYIVADVDNVSVVPGP